MLIADRAPTEHDVLMARNRPQPMSKSHPRDEPWRTESEATFLLPVGGCGEFGMNCTALIQAGKLYLLDCGASFPPADKLGVQIVLPDLAPLLERFGKVEAYIVTHGHEDHIGGLPHYFERCPAPIFATPWTAALIRKKFERAQLVAEVSRVPWYDPVEVGPGLRVSWIPVNHSIPEAAALHVECQGGRFFHSGDFKIDRTPLYDLPIDLERISTLPSVDLMLVDSTNAHRSGCCPSESTIPPELDAVFSRVSGAIFVTTFASNLWRLFLVLEAARRAGRGVVLVGNGMESCMRTAEGLGTYAIPSGVLVSMREAQAMQRSDLVVLATGSQGEPQAALTRIIFRDDPGVRLEPGDALVFSSRFIPGNERSILTLMNAAAREGAALFSPHDYPKIHVSGHGYLGDVLDFVRAVRPRHVVPVHGTTTHLLSNARGLQASGVTDVSNVHNGDIIRLCEGQVSKGGLYFLENIWIDQESHLPLDLETLRGRLRIGYRGAVFASVLVRRKRRRWILAGAPRLSVTGLPLLTDVSADWRDELSERMIQALKAVRVESLVPDGEADQEVSELLRVTIRRWLLDLTGARPIIQIHLVDVDHPKQDEIHD